MIILDTNVVSEPLKPNPNPTVIAWLDQQVAQSLFLTSTSLSELNLGVDRLPEGKRKQALTAKLDALLQRLFLGRILAFDEPAARACASLVGGARRAGQSISVADGQIASIATIHRFAVATRDIAPFVAMGVSVINPWAA